MRKVVITMTGEEFNNLLDVVVKVQKMRIRPAVKVMNILDKKARYVVEEDEPASREAAPQEPPTEPSVLPGPSHTGRRPVRGRRQST